MIEYLSDFDADDEVVGDFYDEDADSEEFEEDEYEEGYDLEVDDEETFEPDDDFGSEEVPPVEEWEFANIPSLLTPTNNPLGNVSIMKTGESVVNVELDFKNIMGVSEYEIRVTPLD